MGKQGTAQTMSQLVQQQEDTAMLTVNQTVGGHHLLGLEYQKRQTGSKSKEDDHTTTKMEKGGAKQLIILFFAAV